MQHNEELSADSEVEILAMDGQVIFGEPKPAYMTLRQAERLAQAEPDHYWLAFSGGKIYRRYGPNRWAQHPTSRESTMKRIYLSGPMTGLPDDNYPAFNAATAALRAQGYHVESPAENPPQESWEAYMALALAQMLTCEEVYLLPRWEISSGAVIEASVAARLGKPIRLIGTDNKLHPDDDLVRMWLCTKLVRLPAPGELRRSA